MKHNKGDVSCKKEKGQVWTFTSFFIILALAALACSAPAIPNIPFIQSDSSTSGLSPTPPGDTLTYLSPAYAINLDPGETIPGTRMTYVGRSNDAYEVSIDGQNGLKRSGDSFFWSGPVAPGVYANYKLRLTASIFGGLPVAGPVELVVFNPEPFELDGSLEPDAYLHFGNLFMDYTVPAGLAVPGTTLRYEGVEVQGIGDQSSQLARFQGLPGYPNIAVGDSLVWTGSLRENVIVRYSLRALSFDERNVHLVGTGEMWILP
jgi:hypothetical protein